MTKITGNVARAASEPTQLLIDPATPKGRASGLHVPSAVKCENLFTISRSHILRTIGHLSPALLEKVGVCLKASLELT